MEDTSMFSFKVKSIIQDYDVQFISDLETSLNNVVQKEDYIIIDSKIKELYHDKLYDTLSSAKHVFINANEVQKSYQGIIPIITELIESGFRKNHRLIAIGGGIIQDITAFIASIIYRGVEWIFYPTTLLSQCDSCIGSKTSINFGEYKNQIGGFYPPSKIFICSQFIDTLADAELKSGLGEMLHYYIISGKEDFEFYRNSYQKAFLDKEILSTLIKRSLEIKKGYIEVDEFDKNIRQVFNYGHSFGHAIETLTNYKVPHGIAVSYGMDIANFISVRMGYISDEIRNEIRGVTKYFWSEFPIYDINIDLFIKALSKDKKNVGNKLGLILNKGYGKIFKQMVDADDNFYSWIQEYFSNELIIK
jgi:3-dehydroquinate synthase